MKAIYVALISGLLLLTLDVSFLRADAPPIQMKWVVNEGNLFVRDAAQTATLEISNVSSEAMPKADIIISCTNRFTDDALPSFTVSTTDAIPANGESAISVPLHLEKAGEYQVVAHLPDGGEATCLISVVLGAAPADPVDGALSFFGNSSHLGFDEPDWILRREFGSRAERGSIIDWEHVKKDPGDELTPAQMIYVSKQIAGAMKHGSQVFGYTGYSPPYAVSYVDKDHWTMEYSPDLPAYMRWVEAAGKGFKDRIHYWEVWNEPNGDGTFFKGTPEQLADLHKAASLILKRIDPSIKIIGASTVSVDPHFMDRLEDAGAIAYSDVIAFHNYVWASPPDPTAWRNLRTIIEWRDHNAPLRPLWDDEFSPQGGNEHDANYANLTARQLVLTRALGIQHSDFYTWDGADMRLFEGRHPLMSGIAYRTAAQFLTNATPSHSIRENDDSVYEYAFTRPGDDTLLVVAWTTGASGPRTLKDIPVDPAAVKCYDAMGNEVTIEPRDGKVDLHLTDSPLYLTAVSKAYVTDNKPLAPSPNGAPPKLDPSMFMSFHYPAGTEVLSVQRGKQIPVELTVYNVDPDQPHTGELLLSTDSTALSLKEKTLTVTVPPRSSVKVTAHVSAASDAPFGIGALRIESKSDQSLGFGVTMIRCEVSDDHIEQFQMTTWEMAQHVVSAEKYGQGVGIRWINPGGNVTFAFDLSSATHASLEARCDGISPARLDGGTFQFRVSIDGGKSWTTLLNDRGDWAWRTIELTPFVGNNSVQVRFENVSDKGSARLTDIRLHTSE